MTWGCLLVNLGTPYSTEVDDVRRYLGEFLMDPRVIDVPDVPRWMIVNLAILPRRPRESAHAYQQVWTDRGSPLLVHGEALRDQLRARLAGRAQVELAMRYQNPSIEAALTRFRNAGVDRILVVPLYPQYASATTGSTMQRVWEVAGSLWNTPTLANVPAFYDHPAFVRAFAEVGRPVLDELRPDHVLISFHGVPERQIHKGDESSDRSHCLRSDSCCDTIGTANRNCYRAQCVASARAIAGAAGLPEGSWSVAFQSRLGRDPWLQPYTDARVAELARSGVRRLAVYCPAFVADCLETIEEIGMRAADDFRAAGGEELRLIPSLNAHPAWIDAVEAIVSENVPPAWER